MNATVAGLGTTRSPTGTIEIGLPHLPLASGERLVLFGPNGAGKTTLLRAMAGTSPGARAGVLSSYLPQRPYFFRGSARRNLVLGLDTEGSERAHQLAVRLNAGHLLDRPARALSGGERQRVALARVLAAPAPLVLLDEPLAPLDVRDRALVATEIARATEGRTSVIVTHDRESAASLGERLAVVVDGEIRQAGPVGEVFSLPVDDEVAEIVGIGNVVQGVVALSDPPLVGVECGPIWVWAIGDEAVGDPVSVMFGAESVTVYGGEADAGSARNVWPATVQEIRSAGRLAEIVADAGIVIVALVTPGSLVALDLEPGHQVMLALKATAARAVVRPDGASPRG